MAILRFLLKLNIAGPRRTRLEERWDFDNLLG